MSVRTTRFTSAPRFAHAPSRRPAQAVEHLEQRQLFAYTPGGFDASFSGDGRMIAGLPGYDALSSDAIVQSDGKTLVATWAKNDVTFKHAYYLARYTATGGVDSTFGGGDGVTALFLPDMSGSSPHLALQADGKIVVAATTGVASDYNYRGLVARLHPNGTLDNSFDGDGLLVTPLAWKVHGWEGVAVTAGGKIVLAGDTTDDYTDVIAVRLNANGTPDASFSTDGRAYASSRTAPGNGVSGVTGMALQADGKVVVAGYTPNPANYANEDSFLLRFDAAGQLDTSFSGDGKARVDWQGGADDRHTAVAIAADGKIVAGGMAGMSGNTAAFFRYNTDGTPDKTFGNNGMAKSDEKTLVDIVVMKTGHVVGLFESHELVRHLPGGTKDATFATVSPQLDDQHWGEALAKSGEDKVVAVGSVRTGGYDVFLTRHGAASVPNAPGEALAVPINSTTVAVAWTDKSVNEAYFQVQWATNANFYGAKYMTVAKNTTVYNVTGLQANTQYYFRVRATTDAGGSAWTAGSPAKTLPQPTLRINVGGGSYTDSLGRAWSADQYYTGGTAVGTLVSINNTTDDSLYASRRYGNFSYAVPVSNGTYTIKLHFAETGVFSAGTRTFDVFGEGQLVADNVDVYASAGVSNPYVRTVSRTVADGVLNLGFVGVAGGATLSAIEIVPV